MDGQAKALEWENDCRERNYEKVVKEFKEVQDEISLTVNEYSPVVFALIETQEMAFAEALLQELHKAAPDTLVVYQNYSFLLMRSERWDEGVLMLSECLKDKFPDQPELLWNLGICLMQTMKPKEAIEVLKRCHKIEPKWQEPLIDLALVHMQQDQLGVAKEYIDQALGLDPENMRGAAVQKEIEKAMSKA